MTDGRRQFSFGPSGAVWAPDHLGPDVIVAFVDDELASGARRRALSHLSGCGECASEVVEQTQARIFLRASSVPSTPSSLLASLRDIPSLAELPSAPAGLAVGPEGELVSMVRTRPVRRGGQSERRGGQSERRGPLDRRAVRVSAGAVVSGIALGALVLTGSQAPGPGPGGPTTRDVRLQLGGGLRDTGLRDTRLRDTADVSVASRSAATTRVSHHRWYR
jgi:hypothetical protein